MQNPYTPPAASLAGGTIEAENTSGVKGAALPAGVAGWSWGAFLLNWIWAIGNSTWIGLLCLVPYVGLVMAIVLGFKGREWAWQNRRWESVAHFNEVQKKWSFWGVVITLGFIVLGIVAMVAIVGMMSQQH